MKQQKLKLSLLLSILLCSLSFHTLAQLSPCGIHLLTNVNRIHSVKVSGNDLYFTEAAPAGTPQGRVIKKNLITNLQSTVLSNLDFPMGLDVHPTTGMLYVGERGFANGVSNNRIHVIDPTTNTPLTSFTANGVGEWSDAFTIDQTGRLFVIVNTGTPGISVTNTRIRVYNTNTGNSEIILTGIPLTPPASAIRFLGLDTYTDTMTGITYLVVSNATNGNIHVFDIQGNNVIAQRTFASGNSSVANVTIDNNKFIHATFGNNSLRNAVHSYCFLGTQVASQTVTFPGGVSGWLYGIDIQSGTIYTPFCNSIASYQDDDTYCLNFSLAVNNAPLYVRQDGNDANNGLNNTMGGAKATIQAAVNAATSGQPIHIVNTNNSLFNEDVTISKDLIINATNNPIVKSIIVTGTGCNGGYTLTFTGNVGIKELLKADIAATINANGKITLLGTATSQGMLVQNGSGIINGEMNIQRYLRANAGTTSLGYRFISSPTSNATFNQISELNPVVNVDFNTSTTPGRVTPFPTLYSYDATRAGDPSKTFTTSPFPEFDKGWVSPAALTEAMGVGRGYTINTSSNQVVEITGIVNNGNINIPIVTGNAASLGYNLVGNPYPAPIKWSAIRALSTGVNNAIYQNMATGQYTGSWASFVGGVGTNGATDDIAVMQGFFVIANTGGNIVMNNTVRATTYTNPNSFRTEDDTNTPKNQGLLRLAMTNSAGKVDETVVYFTDKATQNFDSQYDAVKFQLNSGNFPNIYTTDTKTLFSINALPNLTDDLIIPISVQSWTGGLQKIAMTEKINFVRDVQVFLKDKSTGNLHDLSKGSFEFSMSSGVISDRFELIFKPQLTQSELNGDIVNVYPNPTTDIINISIGDEYKGILTLRLIDVSGREIWSEKTEKSSKIYSTSLENLASGTYFLEVESERKVVKKIIKQ